MARFVELSREISDGMGGISPRHDGRVRDAASFPLRAFDEILG